MCGRYYVDDETAKEIELLVRETDKRVQDLKRSGDMHPADYAVVITGQKEALHSTVKRWGIPGFGRQKIIFNARSESVLEKKMFRESILNRRLIVPAAGFYEWNHNKEKVTFLPVNGGILYMAGFYQYFGNEDCFIILTTDANSSVKGVHERMPLILESEEINDWLWNQERFKNLLKKRPLPLAKKSEYEQQTLKL